MSLSTPKKALVGAALLMVVTLAIFSYFLVDINNISLNMYLQGRPLLQSSDTGKLVARSQLNFHHIVEQWVPPVHKGRHKRIKERFIEDGRVIREDIEYPESENDFKREPFVDPNRRHSNLSLPLIHDENKQVLTGKESDESTPYGNLSSTDKGKDEVVQKPPPERNMTRALDESKDMSDLNLPSLRSNDSAGKRDAIMDSPQLPIKAIGEQPRAEMDNRWKAVVGIHSKPNSSNSGKLSNTTVDLTAAKTHDSKLKVDRQVRSADPAKRHAVFDPSTGKSKVVPGKSVDDDTYRPGFVRVVSTGANGRKTVKYVKLSNSKSEHSQDNVKKGGNDLPAATNNDEDLGSDPKYAHLPLSVRKRIAALRRERRKRLEYTKLIREKCEGEKYCLRVRYRERHLHDSCFYQAIKQEKGGVELNPCTCKLFRLPTTYVNGRRVEANDTRPRVALVSLPGSGNTWVRGLLELATGYCTGSMWCDPTLRAMQFCAEGIRADTLVIKNHDAAIRWYREKRPVNATEFNKPMFSSAIFVHRDPYDANIAEWNRALGFKVRNATKHNQTVAGIGHYDFSDLKDQHTITFGKEAFGLNAGWNETIFTQMENWETMVHHLLINTTGDHPVLLVKYEDLKKDTLGEVNRMVSFLGEDMLPAAEVTLREGFQTFHRNHSYTFDHYTQEQKEYINSVIIRVAKQLELNNVDYLHVKKYLREIS